jgi:early secretory antigenic target protein ESAT-6
VRQRFRGVDVAGDLTVDFDALIGLQAKMSGIFEQVEEQLAALSKQVNNLLSIWEGAASEGFQRTLASWQADAADLQDRLAELHNMVGTTHDNHARAVHANTAIWLQ